MSDIQSNKYLSELGVLGIHPVTGLLPIAGNEYITNLAENIKKDGLKEPIVITKDGLLVSERNQLIAYHTAGVTPKVKTLGDDQDPIAYFHENSFSKNDHSLDERALYAANLEKLMLNSKESIEEIINSIGDKAPTKRNIKRKVRDEVISKTGATNSNVSKASMVIEYEPELIGQIYAGKISLKDAHKKALETKQLLSTYSEQKPSKKILNKVIHVNGEESEIYVPLTTKFNPTKGNIDWAKWSWNPITGCLHDCSFCYAKAIASNGMYSHLFPFGFEPVLHLNRLDAPKNTKADGSRVFVCSMADLFGKWIPDLWIELIFESCMSAPEHEYIFLTKWPNRYNMLETLPKAWFGASIIKQADVARVEKQMKSFSTTGKKWISLEPMLGPIVFNDLSWCDLVVIGAQTAANGQPAFAPDIDWVLDVINQCRDAGVPYYLKSNLEKAPGMKLPRNFPSL